jgi:hypothetical protein
LSARIAAFLAMAVPAAGGATGAESALDPYAGIVARTERAIRASEIVVLATVDRGAPRPPPGEARLLARQVLKGSLDAREIPVLLKRTLSREDFGPDPSAWYLVRRADGRFDEAAPAVHMADYFFMELIARMERKGFAGIEPRRVPDGLVLELALDSGLGRASKTPIWSTGAAAPLLVAQLTNYGARRTLLPPLDGSEREERYPELRLELEREGGRAVPKQKAAFVCGNISGPAPEDFVDLGDGESLRFMVRLPAFFHFRVAPGSYRARLHYAAKRSLRGVNDYVPRPAGSKRMSKISEAAAAKLQTLWEGSLVSEWLSFTVR